MPPISTDDKAVLIEAIAAAVSTQLNASRAGLSDEEQHWVRLAIKREAQSIALRHAIIEKSLSSLVWIGIVGLGYLMLDYLRNHGFKV
jgi:uncharacterized protein involved in exopolysaccharide biosynthesis